MIRQALQVAELATEYTPRYQVGYAQHLRNALPNATLRSPSRGTRRPARTVILVPYSGITSTSYDMQQAKEDGATVAIYFESRLAKLSLKQDDFQPLMMVGG